MSIEAMKQAVEAFEHIKKYVTDDGAMPENWDAYHEKEYFALEALRQAIEQAERKPVKSFSGGVPWYATDAPKHEDDDIQEYKKPWVGLTDEEIDYLEDAIDPAMYRVFARRIEAKLKEKNHD
jgi:hypothetical protein